MAKRTRLIVAAGILAIAAPLLWAMTLPGVFVGDGADLFSYQMPMRDALAATLRRGELLAWNPYVLGGVAAHAGMQLGQLYPLNIAVALVTGKSTILLLYFVHLLLLGAGGAVLARVHLGDRAVASPWPLLGSAAVWLGAGATWGHLWAGHVSFVEAWALWPWLWAAVLRAWQTRTAAMALLAAGVLALQVLAGHPQVTFLCLIGLVPLLLAHVLTQPQTDAAGWPGSLAALAVLATTGLGAALLAAGQLLPTAAMADHLNRSLSTPQELAMAFSAPPRSLLTVLAPHVWGGPGHKLSDVSYHESLAWVGAAGLALGMLGALRSGRRGAIFLGAIAFFVVLSLGKDSPLLPTLVDLVPGFGAFRVPSRWLVPAVALLALLVADGLSPAATTPIAAKKPGAKPSPVAQPALLQRVGPFVLLALAAVPLVLALQVDPAHGWWSVLVQAKAQEAAPLASLVGAELLGVACAFAVAGWMLRDGSWHARLAPAMALVAVAEAAWFGGQHVGTAFQRPQADVAWTADEATTIGQAVDADHRLATAAALRQADFGARANVRIAGGYEPTVTREANWYGNLLSGRTEDGYSVNFQVRGPSPWLDRLAVSQVLVDPRDPSVQRGFSTWPVVQTLPSGRQLRQNPKPMARLAWAQALAIDPDAKAVIARLAQTAPDTTVLAESLPHTAHAGGALQLLKDTSQRVVAQVTATGPAVLVLRDALAPGWSASLDGQPQPIVRADGLFRAVAVPAGQHQVVWQFAAPGLQAGMGISAVAWLAWIAALIVLRRRQKAL
jgi:hypothetical protein